MSAYVRISKKIGFERKTVVVPPIEEVAKLWAKAQDENDEAAFEKIFECYRFATSEMFMENPEAMNAVIHGFDTLAPKFQGLP